jgi:putative FmdB family regulatory protein
MPLYEYFCPQCEERFESFRYLSERNDVVECPSCGHQSERVLSAFAMGKSAGGSSSKSSCSTGGWSGG